MMCARVLGSLTVAAALLAGVVQADTIIPCPNDDLSIGAGNDINPANQPFNYWIDFPTNQAVAGGNGSIDVGQGENGMNRMNIWPGWDGGSGNPRAYPSNQVYSNIWNLGPALSAFPGGNGIQAGHTYQFTVGVEENPTLTYPGVPGPTFQAFLIDEDPNWQSDGGQQYTTVAAGQPLVSTTSWTDISSAPWTAPDSSAGHTFELYVLVNGYYGLPNAWDGTMSCVSNLRLYDVATPVPEPATMTVLAAGLVALLAFAWRRRRA